MPAAKSSHAHELDDQLLIRYSVYLADPDNPDYDGRRLSSAEIAFISAHLKACPPCRNRLAQLSDEYREIEQYLDQSGFPDMAKAAADAEAAAGDAGNSEPMGRRSLWRGAIAVAASLLLAAGWSVFGPVDDTVKLAQIDPAVVATVIRGELPMLLARGRSAVQQGRTEAAIADFRRFIVEHGSDAQVHYGHYMLGVSYLLQARNSLPGPWAGFDTEVVDRAILNLEIALEGSGNTGIAEDCHWYIGKAHIMKAEWRQAEASMQHIIEIRGRRLDQAEQLAAAIRKR